MKKRKEESNSCMTCKNRGNIKHCGMIIQNKYNGSSNYIQVKDFRCTGKRYN